MSLSAKYTAELKRWIDIRRLAAFASAKTGSAGEPERKILPPPSPQARQIVRLKSLEEIESETTQKTRSDNQLVLSEGQLRSALDLIVRAAAEIPRLHHKAQEVGAAAKTILDKAKEIVAEKTAETERLRVKAQEEEERARRAEERVVEAERRADEAVQIATNAFKSLTHFRRETIERLGPATSSAFDSLRLTDEEGLSKQD